jgi:hypothetical protein
LLEIQEGVALDLQEGVELVISRDIILAVVKFIIVIALNLLPLELNLLAIVYQDAYTLLNKETVILNTDRETTNCSELQT